MSKEIEDGLMLDRPLDAGRIARWTRVADGRIGVEQRQQGDLGSEFGGDGLGDVSAQ